jgi:hypothetical protein
MNSGPGSVLLGTSDLKICANTTVGDRFKLSNHLVDHVRHALADHLISFCR